MPGAAARELGLLVTLVLNCAVSNDLQITMGLVVLRWIQCSAASTTLRLSDTDSQTSTWSCRWTGDANTRQ